jgi:Rad3-related DNA helicase
MSPLKKDLIKYNPRKEQLDVLEFIKTTKQNKPDTKFFMLNMPTGTGKSHTAVMISDYYKSNIDSNAKIDIITAGKILQDQYDETYDSINNLKGKQNYECLQYSCSCSQGKEFNRLNKTSCESCPYDNARNSFIGGELSLTNFHLYLINALYDTAVSKQRQANVLIVDECHELDSVMCDFISIKISEASIKKMRFTNEDKIITKMRRISSINQYITFLEYLRMEVLSTIEDIDEGLISVSRTALQDKRDLKLKKMLGGVNDDIKTMQVITDLTQYSKKIDLFLKEYQNGPENWVLETYLNQKNSNKELSLEPIWASDYLNKYVWSKYDMVILMSGTILDKRLFSELNGIDVNKSAYYSINSPFPLKNRLIYYISLGKMSYDKKEKTFENYVIYIKKILKKYPDVKGIIHTNSFELSKWIERDIQDPRLIFHDPSNKDDMLKRHFDSNEPTVFVSPSVSTGVSFDHDKSRFQVIAKIPYPSLSSNKNKLRQTNNPEWYSYVTVANIIQMCGRSIRSVTDYADTIIIDGSFSDIMRHNSHLIPEWLQVAIKPKTLKTQK